MNDYTHLDTMLESIQTRAERPKFIFFENGEMFALEYINNVSIHKYVGGGSCYLEIECCIPDGNLKITFIHKIEFQNLKRMNSCLKHISNALKPIKKIKDIGKSSSKFVTLPNHEIIKLENIIGIQNAECGLSTTISLLRLTRPNVFQYKEHYLPFSSEKKQRKFLKFMKACLQQNEPRVQNEDDKIPF